MARSQRRDVESHSELFGRALVVGHSERESRELVDQTSPIIDAEGARLRVWPPSDPGASPDTVLSSVADRGHDLVVKAVAHAGQGSGAEIDALDARLIRQCPCPVWLSDPTHATPVRRVLAAVNPVVDDRASQARNVLSTAAAVAETAGAELHVLHAWIPYGETLLRPRVSPEELREYVAEERATAAARVERSLAEVGLRLPASRVHLVQGHFQEVLPAVLEGERIGLVVMGTRGRGGWTAKALVRPYPEVVLRETCSPLLVVKSGTTCPAPRRPPEGVRA